MPETGTERICLRPAPKEGSPPPLAVHTAKEGRQAVFVAVSPHELYERKVTMQELHAAIASLPDKQAKRIYAHFILGMTKQDIARAEGVHEKVVRVAIERGLRRLEKILKNSL